MTHPNPSKRVAIYARVSTTDKGQDPATQLLPLLEYCKQRGFRVQREFVDYASGKKNDRAQYRAMLDGVRKRQYDIVLVWRFDRFDRSTQALHTDGLSPMKISKQLGLGYGTVFNYLKKVKGEG